MRPRRSAHAVLSTRDAIYAIGGSGVRGPVAHNTWAKGPKIGARGTSAAAVYRSGLYGFGGESQIQAKALNAVMRLSSLRGAWRRVSKLPTARNYARFVAFKDAVYVVGGSRVAGDSHGAAGSNVVERFFIRRWH